MSRIPSVDAENIRNDPSHSFVLDLDFDLDVDLDVDMHR
jgi:hypothetical protein